MERIATLLGRTSLFSGADPGTLRGLADLAERREYGPGEWLFHESTPRQWFGVVEQGEVELVRGLHGQQRRLAVLGEGGVLSEGLLLDDLPHSTSALTRQGAVVVQFSRTAVERARKERPDLYYRVAARVAQMMSERLRFAAERLAGEAAVTLSGATRLEHDLLGEREVPAEVYYGIQTLRAVENFPISGIRLSGFQHFIEALAFIKKACALANCELGILERARAEAIAAACDELLAGKLHDQFVVDMVQGGAGTSTNMNANEVIANRALELLGHEKGAYAQLHPNDHVNLSQSTNDVYPTAIRLAVNLMLQDVLAAMGELKAALEDKEHEFADVLKMGRTQLQDAVPMTLGQEFGAYAVMIGEDMDRLREASNLLKEINLGATAIGTGINSPPGYADLVTRKLREVSGVPVVKSYNLVEATQDSGAYVQMSGVLKRVAVKLSKICNDLRLLSSGPRCGLQEIRLPPMQPGDPGGGEPGLLRDHRQRHDHHHGGRGRPARAERDGADHRPEPVRELPDAAQRLRHPGQPVHPGHPGGPDALPAVRRAQHRAGDGAEPGDRLRAVRGHRQGGPGDGGERLRAGAPEEVDDPGGPGRAAAARAHDPPAPAPPVGLRASRGRSAPGGVGRRVRLRRPA